MLKLIIYSTVQSKKETVYRSDFFQLKVGNYVGPRCMLTYKSQELEKTITNAGVVLPQSSMPSLQSASNVKANGSPNGDRDLTKYGRGSAVW